MQLLSAIDRTRYNIFEWRYNLSIPWKIVMAVAMAGLTGVLAQVRIPLEWSPIPIADRRWLFYCRSFAWQALRGKGQFMLYLV